MTEGDGREAQRQEVGSNFRNTTGNTIDILSAIDFAKRLQAAATSGKEAMPNEQSKVLFFSDPPKIYITNYAARSDPQHEKLAMLPSLRCCQGAYWTSIGGRWRKRGKKRKLLAVLYAERLSRFSELLGGHVN